jgi:O-antigen ligase
VIRVALVVGYGIAFGLSPFFAGLYNAGDWVPVGLGLMMVVTAGAIARPPVLTRPAMLVLGGLAGMALWSLVSSAWAPSIFQATTEGNRYFVLAAIFGTALVIIRSDAAAMWLVGALATGIAIVAAAVLIRLLGSAPATLFINGRLDQPLGYINAEGTVFILGFWLWFSATERRTPWLAGLGAGGATLMACLGLLSESRGAALAMIASLVVVLAIVPRNRVRRMFALLACAAGFGAAAPTMLALYHAAVAGPIPADSGHRAALAALFAAAAVGILWGAATAVHGRLTANDEALARRVHRLGAGALAALGIAVCMGAVASAPTISDRVSSQWNAFVHLAPEPGSQPTETTSRLVSGAGNRYDYWRVAWDAFTRRPIGGVGAGNYDHEYFKARRTSEDVRQPHSVEMQALSELGLVGGLLLACMIAGLAMGAWRMRRLATSSARERMLMVAAVGVITGWFVHTSVDWMHLMPGVTGIALAMAGVLVRERRAAHEALAQQAGPARFALRPVPLAGATLAAVTVVIGVASLSRQGLADHFRGRAVDALAGRPLDAIREANRSLRLDSENPRTYYIKAAALARFNQADAARRTLLQAVAKEPDDFVTWTLLGDLAVRRGRFAEASRNYSRAAELNPRDPSLRQLARNPQAALTGGHP